MIIPSFLPSASRQYACPLLVSAFESERSARDSRSSPSFGALTFYCPKSARLQSIAVDSRGPMGSAVPTDFFSSFCGWRARPRTTSIVRQLLARVLPPQRRSRRRRRLRLTLLSGAPPPPRRQSRRGPTPPRGRARGRGRRPLFLLGGPPPPPRRQSRRGPTPAGPLARAAGNREVVQRVLPPHRGHSGTPFFVILYSLNGRGSVQRV